MALVVTRIYLHDIYNDFNVSELLKLNDIDLTPDEKENRFPIFFVNCLAQQPTPNIK